MPFQKISNSPKSKQPIQFHPEFVYTFIVFGYFDLNVANVQSTLATIALLAPLVPIVHIIWFVLFFVYVFFSLFSWLFGVLLFRLCASVLLNLNWSIWINYLNSGILTKHLTNISQWFIIAHSLGPHVMRSAHNRCIRASLSLISKCLVWLMFFSSFSWVWNSTRFFLPSVFLRCVRARS